MPNPEVATNYPRGASAFVANMQYTSAVGVTGETRVYLGTPIALNALGFLTALSIAAVNTGYNTWNAAYSAAIQADTGGLAQYGRNVTVVASGAATSTVTVHGRDYLQQGMSETFTLNGATPVLGKKAFKWVDSIDSTITAATTIALGWGNALGVPWCSDTMMQENVNEVVPGSAGTFVTADKTSPATATTGDTRGTYTPNAANLPDGTRTFRLILSCDRTKLHGVAHYF